MNRKKIFSGILVLAMLFAVLSTNPLIVSGSTGTSQDQLQAEQPVPPAPGSVAIDKSAVWTDSDYMKADVSLSIEGHAGIVGVDAILVLDYSYSMSYSYSHNSAKIENLREGVKQFLKTYFAPETYIDANGIEQTIESQNRVALVRFNSSATTFKYGSDKVVFLDLAAYKEQLNYGGSIASNSDLGGFLNKGPKVVAKYADALNAANTIAADRMRADSTRPLNVVFMSDGAPRNSYGENDIDFDSTGSAAKSIKTATTKLKTTLGESNTDNGIYTIGYGATSNNAQDWLEHIAKKDGYPIFVTENTDLIKVFEDIAIATIAAGTNAVVKDSMGRYAAEEKFYFAMDTSKPIRITANGATTSHNFTGNTVNLGKYGTLTLDTTTNPQSFQWVLGDIPSYRITLTYGVKLPDGALNGLYKTNTEASIDYKDVQGQDAQKTFPVPIITKPGKSIRIVYYAVNDQGHYINSQGNYYGGDNKLENIMLNGLVLFQDYYEKDGNMILLPGTTHTGNVPIPFTTEAGMTYTKSDKDETFRVYDADGQRYTSISSGTEWSVTIDDANVNGFVILVGYNPNVALKVVDQYGNDNDVRSNNTSPTIGQGYNFSALSESTTPVIKDGYEFKHVTVTTTTVDGQTSTTTPSTDPHVSVTMPFGNVVITYVYEKDYNLLVKHVYGDGPNDTVGLNEELASGSLVAKNAVFTHGTEGTRYELDGDPVIQSDDVSTLSLNDNKSISGTMPDADVTIIFNYKKTAKYNVLYVPGDVDPSISGMPTSGLAYYAKDTIPVASEIPTRYGYKFVGWEEVLLTGETAVSITEKKFTMPARNVTFRAAWEIDDSQVLEYKVKYHYDGEHDATLDKDFSVQVLDPNVLSVIPKPKDGFVEAADFTDPALPTQITAENNVINVYYVSTLEYTVKYHFNGVHDKTRDKMLSVTVSDPTVDAVPSGLNAGEAYVEAAKFTDPVLPTTISKTNNVINVYYVSALEYTVKYHFDGVHDEARDKTLLVPLLAPTVDAVPSGLNAGEAYVAAADFTDPALPTEITAENNVINVYYVSTLEYTVKYHFDGVHDKTRDKTLSVTVSAPTVDAVPSGLNAGEAYVEAADFTDPALPTEITAENNVINVYYVSVPETNIDVTMNHKYYLNDAYSGEFVEQLELELGVEIDLYKLVKETFNELSYSTQQPVTVLRTPLTRGGTDTAETILVYAGETFTFESGYTYVVDITYKAEQAPPPTGDVMMYSALLALLLSGGALTALCVVRKKRSR